MTMKEASRAKGVFHIINLDCSGCARIITKSLRKIDGVQGVNINYITDKVYVDYDPKKVSSEKIRKTIEKAGYTAFEATHSMAI